jgi:hypothetical protein
VVGARTLFVPGVPTGIELDGERGAEDVEAVRLALVEP